MKLRIAFLFLITISVLTNCFSQTVIKMKREGGISIIPCKVNGLNLNFIFDTGASDVSLSMTEANFMLKNGYLSINDIIGSNKFKDASGNINEGVIINLREIEIGGLKLYDIKASIVKNNKAPLLLGQTAIGKLGKIQLDLASNSLTILTNTATSGLATNNKTSKFEEQTIKSSIKIGNLEIVNHKIKGVHSWEEAKLLCKNLGNNWRLPTIEELEFIDKYKESIMPFDRFFSYWSSTEYDNSESWSFDFFPREGSSQGSKSKTVKTYPFLICPVRDCDYINPPEITNTYSIGTLEIAKADFPVTMNWIEANKACIELGNGWRLPTKWELNLLFKNIDKIGGLKIANYWSSTENPATGFAWLQNLFSGYQGEGTKDFVCNVRAVRNK
jgi:clan AA aspartic protease (TIGR02281 family)